MDDQYNEIIARIEGLSLHIDALTTVMRQVRDTTEVLAEIAKVGLVNDLMTDANAAPGDSHERLRDDQSALVPILQPSGQQNRDSRVSIVFIGTYKAKKSSLINALLDPERTSADEIDESSVLTRYRCARVDSLRVTFYSEEEWAQIWATMPKEQHTPGTYNSVVMRNYAAMAAESIRWKYVGSVPLSLSFATSGELWGEIQKWTSAKRPEHYFVKHVDVGLANFYLPIQAVLVNTPALDDPLGHWSDEARSDTANASAAVVCASASSTLTGLELATLKGLFDRMQDERSNVYVIGTHPLTADGPPVKWADQKREWVKELSGPQGYASEALAIKNIMGVAPQIHKWAGRILAANTSANHNSGISQICTKYGISTSGSWDTVAERLVEWSYVAELRKALDSFVSSHPRLSESATDA